MSQEPRGSDAATVAESIVVEVEDELGPCRIRRAVGQIIEPIIEPIAPIAPIAPLVPIVLAGPEAEVADGVNSDRAAVPLAALVADSCLMESAREHTRRMAAEGRLFHSDVAHQYRNCRGPLVGENVGCGATLEQIRAALIQSPLHRDNILNPLYECIGCSAVTSAVDGLIYVTQAFLQVSR